MIARPTRPGGKSANQPCRKPIRRTRRTRPNSSTSGPLDRRKIVCQIELFALVLIRWLWKEQMCNRRCLFFVDNEVARYAAIKGSSDNLAMRNLMRAFLALDLTHPLFAWIESVPSKSNLADPPSRQCPEEACKLLEIDSWEIFNSPDHLLEFLLKGLVLKKGEKRKPALP